MPRPAPGELLLKVTAAGVCHTDHQLMATPPDQFRHPLPFRLGHEAVGIVAEVGAGVVGVSEGDEVAVYGAWGCGRCRVCASGAENYCPHVRREGVLRPGLGGPGAMAEYMLVDRASHLVPLGGLEPVAAAALTDAGLSSYHAIHSEIDRLGPGATALVIGVGGLGHVGIQILRVLTAARVIAVDVSPAKLGLATALGADRVVLAEDDPQRVVDEMTGGVGADAIFDFVGAPATLDLAVAAVRIGGSVQIVGAGGGSIHVAPARVPFGVRIGVPFWGALPDLYDVIALARGGAISVTTTEFSLDDAPLAYAELEEGRILGRAIVVP